MSRTWSEILVPANGVYVVNNTDEYKGTFYAIKVTADAVISEMSIGKEYVDLEDYISDPTGAVKAGTLITPPNSAKPFTSIELASGQVTLVL